jgi:hypothetical protein
MQLKFKNIFGINVFGKMWRRKFGEEYLNLIRQGNTRLELKFTGATTKAANAIVFFVSIGSRQIT